MSGSLLLQWVLHALLISSKSEILNSYISSWDKVQQTAHFRESSVTNTIHLHTKHRLYQLVVEKEGGNSAENWDDSLIVGHVQGEARSSVVGYLDERRVFTGRVTVAGTLHHVEAAHRYFPLPGFDSVMYRAQGPPVSQYQEWAVPPDSDEVEVKRRTAAHGKVKRRAGRNLDSLKNRTCAVLLAADHLFFKHIGGGSRKTTTKELLLHLYEANKIFRSTDFDFDGRSDNIGFSVGNITIFERENMAENKFYGEIKSSSEYLLRWSQYDHSSYCLALCFTYRDFKAGVLGLAYVGAKDRTGGICDQRYAVNGQRASFNTGIVSMMNFGAYVGHDVSFIILAHELGHNFGASHDPNTAQCSPGSDYGGNYVMYDKATNGDLPHNNVLSLCSREAILDVLLTPSKTVCFRGETSYCGNGIKEWNEECDCGSSDTCPHIDPCCVPSDSNSSKPCTVVRSLGAQCSPVASECCTASCLYSSNTTVCNEEQDCSLAVLCSGSNATCQAPANKGLLTLCNDKQNTCSQDGHCQGSVCSLLVGLAECQCSEAQSLCEVCCREEVGGVCTSTRHIDNLNLTFLGPGQACMDYAGYCDDQHRCVTINLEDPLSTLDDVFNKQSFDSAIRWVQEHWYYSLSALAAFVALIILFKYTYVRRVPIGRALTRVRTTLRGGGNLHQFAYSDHIITHRHHKPMLLDVAIDRLSILFPTAELHVLTGIARVAGTEEVAVKRLLALDYPMSRLAVSPIDE